MVACPEHVNDLPAPYGNKPAKSENGLTCPWFVAFVGLMSTCCLSACHGSKPCKEKGKSAAAI